ncbi:MAG: hypothetical protein A2792_04895 [Sphingomonadales bacterium RIFCSPHIGHO2_01_FULL_65_20]|uniref:Uncharacterized protein n=2 Tax=Sphingomonadaceae TaxID=41297 RepID=A0A7V8RBX2_9SPHN|nr:hypothetical protein [Sphingomonas ursincola]MBA4778221.1 hypothetical protein [Blastomonas sp.]OHC97997.1 MAG: hypothetical protein A2792_04895 [Sphingomonadales bacterium RIFCSPHIGHO2_01_FULL_65_20]
MSRLIAALAVTLIVALLPSAAMAHKLREQGVAVSIADSPLTVTPGRDWNRLDGNVGKHTETWTLDGGQLNDLTFFAGIEPGKPLVRERSKKREPLPKFGAGTLLVELPELFEATYRTAKQIADFRVTDVQPTRFLGQDGVMFTYEYVDQDQLTRKGEAHAAIVAGRLYMIGFDAPRLHYFERNIGDFHRIVQSARMS